MAALTTTARVVVNVVDVNDCAPIFTHEGAAYNFRVAERLPAGAEVGVVRARDADAPPNDRFRYELVDDDGRSGSVFSLNAETGLLTTKRRLNREEHAAYRMLATARDNADRSLVSTATIIVTVDDINDNSPVFLFPVARNRTVRVSTSGGHVGRWRRLATVRATDADEGPNGRVTYAIVAGHRDQNDVRSARRWDHYFRINATSGDIFADRNFHVTPGSANATFRLTLREGLQASALRTSVVCPAPTGLRRRIGLSRVKFRLTLAAVDGGHTSLRTYSELIIVIEDGPATLDQVTPPIRRDRLSEGFGSRLMASDQNVAVVVAVCIITGIVAAVLVAAIVFVGCRQRVAIASTRLAKSSPTLPCYRAAAGTAATDDYGDSPCGKSSATQLVVGRPGYTNTSPRLVDLGDQSVLPASSAGSVVVRLIDRKYSWSGRREVTSNLHYSPKYGCPL